MHHNESLCVSKASIDGGRCSNAFKIDKIQFSHTFFWFFVFNAAMKLERIILGISSWDTLLSSIDKKGEQKMHVAVAALKAEFSWPSLSFVVRHSKKCLTHLELLRELDEGGALTTTSSKQKMYSRSVFYAYTTFFCAHGEALWWPNSSKDIQKWTQEQVKYFLTNLAAAITKAILNFSCSTIKGSTTKTND